MLTNLPRTAPPEQRHPGAAVEEKRIGGVARRPAILSADQHHDGSGARGVRAAGGQRRLLAGLERVLAGAARGVDEAAPGLPRDEPRQLERPWLPVRVHEDVD